MAVGAIELAAKLAEPKQVISSISQALEMSSPRSASWMLERFGLTATSGEDERCLMINPAVHRLERRGRALVHQCVMDKEELGMGIRRCPSPSPKSTPPPNADADPPTSAPTLTPTPQPP